MSQFFQKFRRDILGVFWLGFAVFLALTLVSFTPSDPSFNSIGHSLRVQNYCGYFGSFLADLLYQGFGVTSWILVGGAFRMCVRAFRNKDVLFAKLRFFWGLLAMLTVASLISLYFPEARWFAGQIYIGGLLGVMVSRALISVFNPLGVAVILWSVTAMLVIFYTEKPLSQTLAWPYQFFKNLPVRKYLFSLYEKIKDGMNELLATPEPREEERPRAESKKIFVQPQQQQLFEEDDEGEDEEDDEIDDSRPLAPVVQKSLFDFRREKEERTRKKTQIKVQRTIENWSLPNLNLLEDHPIQRSKLDEREIQKKSELLVDKLQQFSVNGEIVGIRPGPAVTMFEFKPNADVKISKITELADDLSLALSSESVRIIAPIPGRDVVGIETSNSKRETVFLKDILNNDKFWDDKMKLPIAMGREANGEAKVVDLRKMPHLLVAGTTGSGKSVFVVSAVTGLLFKHSPKSLRLILIDPKQVDLAAFNSVPHLLMPPIREAKKAVSALRWAIKEMDKRYRSMSRFGARGIESFNEIVEKLSSTQIEEHQTRNDEYENQGAMKLEQYYYTPQPYIVIVVEEFGDLMAVDKSNVEQAVVRLAQMARACGIHLVLAMQSPRKDVVTGLIKTNIPGRISFKVASKMDSRIILDESGAERLLAQGDMLFLAPGVSKPQRHHGAWVTEDEISSVMKFWADQGEPEFDAVAMRVLDGSGGGFDLPGDGGGEDMEDGEQEYDEMYDQVLDYVSTMKEVSASLLQRKFRLGYPRAARMIEIFEREGVVGPANGSKPRQVLVNSYAEKA